MIQLAVYIFWNGNLDNCCFVKIYRFIGKFKRFIKTVSEFFSLK